ncbi:hypothetical protein LIER_28221 [Lithospermum erythrorhizon]|uniref:Uncharacterized protein n=1 Tax=Lithospermum erythrorhizon TaxID=34254 RepID=A0AAV3RHY1_LITER
MKIMSIEVCVAIKDWTTAEYRMQDKDALMEENQKDMFDKINDIEEEEVTGLDDDNNHDKLESEEKLDYEH